MKTPNLASIVTAGNALFGLAAIFFSIRGFPEYAVLCMLGAVVCDYADGKIARRLKHASEKGVSFDSLADTISFVVAPVVFAYFLSKTWFDVGAYCLFTISGIYRLAKFHVQKDKGYFTGMPVTVNGGIIPVLFIVGFPAHLYKYVFIISAVLMNARFKVHKIK